MLALEMASSWAGYWMAIPSVSAPSPVSAFLVDRINFGLKVFWMVGVSIALLWFLPGYRKWPLQVP